MESRRTRYLPAAAFSLSYRKITQSGKTPFWDKNMIYPYFIHAMKNNC